MTSSALEVVDTTPLTFTLVTESADSLELGGTEVITITGVADLSGIQTVLIEFEGGNYTMIDLGGGTWRYSTWTPSSIGVYPYILYIQNNGGIWQMTNGTIEVVKTESPGIPAFTLPLVLLVPLLIAGIFCWRKRTK